ncbi:haloacid dehalogenase type II [Bradyrhizobium sp. USDA 4454]
MQTRRTVLAAIAGAALSRSSAQAASTDRIQAIGFDIFTIFDPRSLDDAAETHFPGKGRELAGLWKAKLFDYFFLRTLNGRYVDCRQLGADALRFACTSKGLTADPEAIAAIVDVFFHLKIFPDSAEALRRMRDAGLRLAYVSNLTDAMLKSSGDAAGIAQLFEHRLSTDQVQAYKPDPRAYAMAERAFGLERGKVLFAATGGWDYAGAKSFGLETFWVNRTGALRENLGVEPDGEGRSLTDLANYAVARAR